MPGSIPGSRRSLFGHVGVTFGSLFGHVGVTFSWILEDVGKCLGVLWDIFGWVWDGFENKLRGGRNFFDSQKCLGAFFPDRGALD